ncbi:MAG: hypothetical protein ACXACI_00770 [Candidatus Hodarchaeales archaeon]|jgi:hypothetical protein
MSRQELIRDSLQEFLSQFIPITVVIRNKKLQISEETLQTIQDAELGMKYAEEAELPLPKSTFELCHYGTAIRDKIFPNIDDYQVEQSTKRRARRKGSWQLKLIGWNEKKIKFDIMKFPEPEWEGKKPEKDEKLYSKFVKKWPTKLDKKAIAEYESKIQQLGNLFANPASPTTQKVNQLEHSLKEYAEAEQTHKEMKQNLDDARERQQELINKVEHLDTKTQALNAEIALLSDHQHLISAQNQLQHLQEERKTRSFLKIWRDLLHRYLRWAQRELGASLPVKSLLSLEDNYLDLSVPLEELYDEISAEFIAKAELLYAQRKQFVAKVGSQQQLKGRLENGKSTIFQLRELQQDIEDTQRRLEELELFQKAKEINIKLDTAKKELLASSGKFQMLERSAAELAAQKQESTENLQRSLKKK